GPGGRSDRALPRELESDRDSRSRARAALIVEIDVRPEGQRQNRHRGCLDYPEAASVVFWGERARFSATPNLKIRNLVLDSRRQRTSARARIVQVARFARAQLAASPSVQASTTGGENS